LDEGIWYLSRRYFSQRFHESICQCIFGSFLVYTTTRIHFNWLLFLSSSDTCLHLSCVLCKNTPIVFSILYPLQTNTIYVQQTPFFSFLFTYILFFILSLDSLPYHSFFGSLPLSAYAYNERVAFFFLFWSCVCLLVPFSCVIGLDSKFWVGL
jgi:hypothetical protein